MIENLPGEIWEPIKGYEGLYEISNMGRVKSLPRKISNGFITSISKEIILKRVKDTRRGNLLCFVYSNGSPKNLTFSRCVYETFIGEIPKNYIIDYRDGNKENCQTSNLFTRKRDSIKYLYKNGEFIKPMLGCFNEKSKKNKTVWRIDMNTGHAQLFPSLMECGRWLRKNGHPKAAQSGVWKACQGKRNSAYGYYWEYAGREKNEKSLNGLRRKKGIWAYQISEKLKISYRNYNLIERGLKKPTPEQMQKLSEILDTDIKTIKRIFKEDI